MTEEPKFKLGDDGELEEIIEDFDEKPKRKRKPKPYNRTLQIPLSVMLLLILSIGILGAGAFYFSQSAQSQPAQIAYLPPTPEPTETPGGIFENIPPCGVLRLTQEPRMVFRTSTLRGYAELFRMDIDGSDVCRLTHNNIDDNSPQWSPDGTKIAFASTFYSKSYGWENAIYLMDANGENVTKLTSGFTSTNTPTWSPDGQRIAFSAEWGIDRDANDEIYVMNADGSNVVQLTDDPGIDISPAWSPDGQQIAFSSDRTYLNGESTVSQPDSFEIYVMDADGSNVKQLTSNNQYDDGPQWSPDGQLIAYQHEESIYTINPDGKRNRLLTSRNMGAYGPFWTPDNNVLGFTSEGNALYFLNIETGELSLMSVLSHPTYVDIWSPPITPQWDA